MNDRKGRSALPPGRTKPLHGSLTNAAESRGMMADIPATTLGVVHGVRRSETTMSEPTLYRRCAHYGDLRMQSIHDCDGYVPVEPDQIVVLGDNPRWRPLKDLPPGRYAVVKLAARIGGDDEAV